MIENTRYLEQFRGGFYGVLKWEDLDVLWLNLKKYSTAWYVYQIGEAPPEQTSDEHKLHDFIDEIDLLLRQEHEERYCGIVYINHKETPDFIKIYDPANLGSSCGSSGQPTLPGWTLSRQKPVDLKVAFPIPAKRKRWWKRLFNH